MTLIGRNKRCVMERRRSSTSTPPTTGHKPHIGHKSTQRVMPHGVFMERIRKSMYFGYDTTIEDMECVLSRPLAQYASETFSAPHKGHSLNRLNAVAAGNVEATPCSLIMALIYLDRINLSDPGYARRITPQELFIVSMMISTKFYAGHDEQIYLSNWAADGNMTEDRLKQLELDFLHAIDWKIYISNEQFFAKLVNVERTLAQREGVRRGWLTYTELMQMLPSFTLVRFLLNNITVMAVSYAASVMTIAGAFFLASQVPGTSLHRRAPMPATATDTNRNSMLEHTTVPMGSTTIDEGGTILPARRDQLLDESQSLLGIDESTPLSAASTSSAVSDVVSVIAKLNATCMALNVEMELLKLERQYREESEEEELRQNQRRQQRHELSNEYMFPLSFTPKQQTMDGLAFGMRSSSQQDAQLDDELNWLTWKEQYSDRATDTTVPPPHTPDWQHNGTESFWQLFSAAMATHEVSFLPWLLFKLI